MTDPSWPTSPWHMMLGIGKLELVDDTGSVQTAQLRLSASETRDTTPMPKNFGFESNPPFGTDVIYGALDGQRTKVVALATNHQPSRLKGLASGGSRQYAQDGCQILINNDALIKAFAPGELLHQVVTDVFKQLFNLHTHGGIVPGGGHTAKPDQQMTQAHLTTAFHAGT